MMTAIREMRPDIALVDRETGEARLVVEVRRSWTAFDQAQLVAEMRLLSTRRVLVVTPHRTLLIQLFATSPEKPEIVEVPTRDLLGPVEADMDERELARRVELAFRTRIRMLEDLRDANLPRTLTPELTWALHEADVLVEEYR